MEQFKIEKGIPIPSRESNGKLSRRQVLAMMEDGDSMVISKDFYSQWRSTASAYGYRLSFRALEEDKSKIRMWRVCKIS